MDKAIRRTYLVNKPVQYRYMGIVGIPLVILCGALYYLMYYAVFNEMLIPEAVASTLVPAMLKVNKIVFIIGPIALYFILRAALIQSNRIVGPMPRLEKELEKAIAGDYTVRLKTRDKDELGSLVNKVNQLLASLDKK